MRKRRVDEDSWLISEPFLPNVGPGSPGVCHLCPPSIDFGWVIDVPGWVNDCQPFAVGTSLAIIGNAIDLWNDCGSCTLGHGVGFVVRAGGNLNCIACSSSV